jgi:hypothetical protein
LMEENLSYSGNILYYDKNICILFHYTWDIYNCWTETVGSLHIISNDLVGGKTVHTCHCVTDKLHNIMLYTSPWSRFELTTSVVIYIGTDSKSDYHTITASWGS